jgi:UDP-glucose 4-epimerase
LPPCGSKSPAAGRGFIGGHLVRALERAGHEVRQDWVDVRDRSALQRAVRGCHAVIHMAALYGSEIEAVNVGGTRNVIAACRAAGVGRLVQTSTAARCGLVPGRVATAEDSPPHRELGVPYRRTKLGLANAQKVALARLPAWFSSAKAQRELGYEHAPVEHSVERVVRAALAIY